MSAAVTSPLGKSDIAVSQRGSSEPARAAVLCWLPLAVALQWPLLAGSDEPSLAVAPLQAAAAAAAVMLASDISSVSCCLL